MLALIAVICLLLAGCGGGRCRFFFFDSYPGAGRQHCDWPSNGVWSTLPNAMQINPVHAALLHTGKVLIISVRATARRSKLVARKAAISAGCGADGFVQQHYRYLP